MKKALYTSILAVLTLMTSCRSSFTPVERNDYERSDSAFAHYLKSEGIPYTSNNQVAILNGEVVYSLFKVVHLYKA